MNRLLQIFFIPLATMIIPGVSLAVAQQPEPQKEVIILDNNTPLKRPTTLTYIGEIKGRSYIKIILEPVQKTEGSEIMSVRGTCYEAASGKTHPMSGTIDPETGSWNLRCLNEKRQTIYTFKGRENFEGTIEGDWKSKHAGLSFYLFKKEDQVPL